MKRLCLERLCFVNLNCYLNSNLILRKFKFVKRLCLERLCFVNLNCYLNSNLILRKFKFVKRLCEFKLLLFKRVLNI